MTSRRSWWLVPVVLVAACTRGDDLDPADLTTRDLLGLDPKVAMSWSDAERGAAHHTFDAAFRAVDPDGELTAEVALDDRLAPEAAVARGLDAADADLAASDQPPRLAVLATPDAQAAVVTELVLDGLPGPAATPTPIVLVGWEDGAADGWDALPRRVPGFLVAVAEAAGRAPTAGPLEVVPAPRVGFAAAWLDDRDRLLVNPVLLAALDAEPGASSYPITTGAPIVWAPSARTGGAGDAIAAAPAPADDDAYLAFPAGEDAGPDAAPPPPSGGTSCDGPTCDGPSCGGDGCGGGGCGDGGGCGGGGGDCGNNNSGGQCGVAPHRGGSTVAWFVIPLLLLRRWRLRERTQARRACDPD